MSKSYGAGDVRVLDEIEHIRLNPGMYIGETSNPVHLIEEALDNALDEALAGYANIIAVFINTKEHRYAVLDNGRGIPVEGDTPIIISSKLFSGAKFQDKKTAYEISSGLHGVGLVAVNALSKYYKVEIYRNKKHAVYEFNSTKLNLPIIEPFFDKAPFSTKIEFIPDKKYFENLVPDLDRIRNRLTTASAELSNDIKFILKIDDKQEIFNLSLEDHFKIHCLGDKNKNLDTIYLNSDKNPEKFNIMFTYEQDGVAAPKIISSVNLLPVTQGGIHVTIFYDILKEFLSNKAKKHGYKFQPNDCLYKLRCYFILSLKEPKFSGQTKDTLINKRSEMDKFTKDFKTQLEDFATNSEPLLIDFLERLHEYRSRLDSKKLVKTGTNGKRASTQFTKLRDCTSRLGELYIVEGDSAGGSIIQSRDTKIHAVLPLKGKSIPNITTKKDIFKNKEVGELIKAMGTGLGPHFDISKLRYDKIICATDADHDGNHIACLVTMVIAILTPEIIKQNKFFIAQTPLFAINEGKVFIPLWSNEEVEKARQSGRKLQRYKGLGEMNPNQLKICLLDQPTRNLKPISYSNNIDELIKLFSSAEEKRKLIE